MALIMWNDIYSVHIKEIDDQHKKLIKMVNELNSAMGLGKGREIMGSILAGLIDYTKSHFGTEEELMQKYLYPGYLSHKANHDALTKQVINIMNAFQEGKSIVTIEVMNFLKDWLVNHIQNADQKYAPYLNSKGVV